MASNPSGHGQAVVVNWLVVFRHPSEKYESVNGDDDIPNIWEHKKWQPNHQPDIYLRHQPVKRIE